MKRNVMSFKVMYSDNSGVEYGVNYDDSKVDSEITLQSIGSVDFPINRLDWLIDTLQEIRTNVNEEVVID